MNNLATLASLAPELSENPCESELDRALIKEIFGNDGPALAQFLYFCARSLETARLADPLSPPLRYRRNSFLNAGLAELAFAPSDSRWIQMGARPADIRNKKEVYRLVLDQVRELLDQNRISNFFFLHKPPGLRLRFETRSTNLRSLRLNLWATFGEWQERELIADLTPAVYEPESYLFGGTRSMRFVHDLFTVDSLTWLDFHITNTALQPGAAWAMSLIMLRQIFGHLGITGWEVLDVWERIRDKTGRSLPAEVRDSESFETCSQQIQAAWENGEAFRDQLPAELNDRLNTFNSATSLLLSRWLSEYFQTSHATIGPREAAAFFTIFHWNRAGIPLARQALLTEALLRRSTR
jgi:thiopeptide-type bacteriocin biosynthesis protein